MWIRGNWVLRQELYSLVQVWTVGNTGCCLPFTSKLLSISFSIISFGGKERRMQLRKRKCVSGRRKKEKTLRIKDRVRKSFNSIILADFSWKFVEEKQGYSLFQEERQQGNDIFSYISNWCRNHDPYSFSTLAKELFRLKPTFQAERWKQRRSWWEERKEKSQWSLVLLLSVSPLSARPSPLCQTSRVRTCQPDSPEAAATHRASLKHRHTKWISMKRLFVLQLKSNYTPNSIKHEWKKLYMRQS